MRTSGTRRGTAKAARAGLAVLLSFALAALVSLAHAAPSARGALQLNTNAIDYVAAPICCKGCQYDSGCCCGKRLLIPVTKKIVATRVVVRTSVRKATRTSVLASTVTHTVLVNGKRRALPLLKKREDEGSAAPADAAAVVHQPQVEDVPEEAFEDAEPSETIEQPDDDAEVTHNLFARHLCPVCPASANVINNYTPGGRHNSQPVYCCPPRKTVTKSVVKKKTTTRVIKSTVVRTHTTVQTVTVSAFRKAFSGRLFTDKNNNGVFDLGIDVPIANTAVSLVLFPSGVLRKARAAPGPIVLNSTITDSDGIFQVNGDVVVGQEVAMTRADEPGNPLWHMTVPPNGTLPEYVEVPVGVFTRTTTLHKTQTAAPEVTTSRTRTATHTRTISETRTRTNTRTTTTTCHSPPFAFEFAPIGADSGSALPIGPAYWANSLQTASAVCHFGEPSMGTNLTLRDGLVFHSTLNDEVATNYICATVAQQYVKMIAIRVEIDNNTAVAYKFSSKYKLRADLSPVPGSNAELNDALVQTAWDTGNNYPAYQLEYFSGEFKCAPPHTTKTKTRTTTETATHTSTSETETTSTTETATRTSTSETQTTMTTTSPLPYLSGFNSAGYDSCDVVRETSSRVVFGGFHNGTIIITSRSKNMKVTHWTLDTGLTDEAGLSSLSVDYNTSDVYALINWKESSVTLGGITVNNTGNGTDFLMIKININGSVVWAKSVGSAEDDHYGYLGYSPSNSAVILVGFAATDINFGNSVSLTVIDSIFWAKFNASTGAALAAVEVCNATFATTDINVGLVGFDVDATSGASVFGLSFSGSGYAGTNALTSEGAHDVAVVYLTNAGEVSWTWKFGTGGEDFGPARPGSAVSISQTSGSVLFTFATNSSVPGSWHWLDSTSSPASLDFGLGIPNTFLYGRFSSSGSLTWQYWFQGGLTGNGIVMDGNETNLLMASSWRGTTNDYFTPFLDTLEKDSTGSRISFNNWPGFNLPAGNGTGWQVVHASPRKDGGWWFCGRFDTAEMTWGTETIYAMGSQDSFVAIMDPAGKATPLST